MSEIPELNELDRIRTEIDEYHPLKKIPLVLNYYIDTKLCKIMPKCIQDNKLYIKDFVYKSCKVFITMVFPIVYVYQRDKDCLNDSPLYFENE